jgi:hypothetical protein
METTINDILKHFIPSNEIKNRIKNIILLKIIKNI